MNIETLKNKLTELRNNKLLKNVSNKNMASFNEIRNEILFLNMPIPNIKDRVWCIINYNGIWPKCEICNCYLSNLKRKPRTCSSEECKAKLIKKIKSNITIEQQSLINQKRFETCLEKYGNKGTMVSRQRQKLTKTIYNNIQNQLNQITKLYTKEQLIEKLNTINFNYTKYIGKSKNRTMITDDPILYKSLLEHTKFIDERKLYGDKHVPLTLRLLIAGKLKFNLLENHYCNCKSRLSFDHSKLDFSKKFCDRCLPVGYPGRMSLKKSIERNGQIACPNKGKNEKQLLDQQEIIDNCKIDRNFQIIGFYPDGYCHETNTIYEIYEPYHKKKIDYDNKRRQQIIEHLKCNFKIIYDG